MKFRDASKQILTDPNLKREYDMAHATGPVRVGTDHVFFRSGLQMYALESASIRRCYRRVIRVPLKMCCGSGTLDVEHLVLEDGDGEIAQIQLPGTKAAVALMQELKETLPGAEFSAPLKKDAKKEAL